MIVKNKNRKKGCFFQGNNKIVQGTDLSNGAKGLMCYFLSLPESWEIHLRDLFDNKNYKRFKDGRRAIESQMNELIAAGYVVKKQGENKRRDTTYTVYEIPIHLQGIQHDE